MMPMQLSTSASSSAKGGEFSGGGSGLAEGDWNIQQGSGDIGMSKSTMLYIGIAAVAMWYLKTKKAA